MRTTTFFLLALLFLGCSKDEQDCKCDVKVVIAAPTGPLTYYTVTGVPSDCNGNVDFKSLELPSNHWYQGTVNCR